MLISTKSILLQQGYYFKMRKCQVFYRSVIATVRKIILLHKLLSYSTTQYLYRNILIKLHISRAADWWQSVDFLNKSIPPQRNIQYLSPTGFCHSSMNPSTVYHHLSRKHRGTRHYLTGQFWHNIYLVFSNNGYIKRSWLVQKMQAN